MTTGRQPAGSWQGSRMPPVQLDLRGLPPGRAPSPGDVAEGAEADAVVVRGPVPALAGVLTALRKAGRVGSVPVSWEPADDDDSRGLARDLGIGSGAERELFLVLDDHGGVLLHRGRIEPLAGNARPVLGRRLGLQAHHDAAKIADGTVTRIDCRPDWAAVDSVTVAVTVAPLRPVRRSTGRALQVASDPAQASRDGVPYPRPVTRWTWYADQRVRWRLHP
jgi:hypothetical protein